MLAGTFPAYGTAVTGSAIDCTLGPAGVCVVCVGGWGGGAPSPATSTTAGMPRAGCAPPARSPARSGCLPAPPGLVISPCSHAPSALHRTARPHFLTCLSCIAQSITLPEPTPTLRLMLTELFIEADADRSGFLDRHEFTAVLRNANLKLSDR